MRVTSTRCLLVVSVALNAWLVLEQLSNQEDGLWRLRRGPTPLPKVFQPTRHAPRPTTCPPEDAAAMEAPGCSAMRKNRFFNCPRPVTALASFPGSGNTWLRYLLEQATGVFTGSIYNDSRLAYGGFGGEGRADGGVLAVKTHGPYILEPREDNITYDRAIVLLRHPGPTLLAEFNRIHSKSSHTEKATKEDFDRSWSQYFNRILLRWLMFYKHWLTKFDKPIHVMWYENLQTNMVVELRSVLTFLELHPDNNRILCTERNSEGRFHRKHAKNDTDPYTVTMQERLREVEEEMKYYLANRKS